MEQRQSSEAAAANVRLLSELIPLVLVALDAQLGGSSDTSSAEKI